MHPPLIVLALGNKCNSEKAIGACIISVVIILSLLRRWTRLGWCTNNKKQPNASHSADWSAPSCPLQRGSPASSSDSASRLPFRPRPRFLLMRCHWWPSPRPQRRLPPRLTFGKRRWSLRHKRRGSAAGRVVLVNVQVLRQMNRPMGVLCLSVCFSWFISGGVAPTAGPINSPSLGSVKWKEISARNTQLGSEGLFGELLQRNHMLHHNVLGSKVLKDAIPTCPLPASCRTTSSD